MVTRQLATGIETDLVAGLVADQHRRLGVARREAPAEAKPAADRLPGPAPSRGCRCGPVAAVRAGRLPVELLDTALGTALWSDGPNHARPYPCSGLARACRRTRCAACPNSEPRPRPVLPRQGRDRSGDRPNPRRAAIRRPVPSGVPDRRPISPACANSVWLSSIFRSTSTRPRSRQSRAGQRIWSHARADHAALGRAADRQPVTAAATPKLRLAETLLTERRMDEAELVLAPWPRERDPEAMTSLATLCAAQGRMQEATNPRHVGRPRRRLPSRLRPRSRFHLRRRSATRPPMPPWPPPSTPATPPWSCASPARGSRRSEAGPTSLCTIGGAC